MATNKGLGKGLGALLSIFDEEEAAIEARKVTTTTSKTVTASKGKAATADEVGGRDSRQRVAFEDMLEMPTSSTRRPVTPPAPSAPAPVSKDPFEIDISMIDSNLGQPRKEFDAEKLQELTDSIRTSGIIQPLILVPMGTRYMIVAGERRWRAAKLAGLRRVPAVVRNFTPAQIAEVAIVENLQRQDLNEIELARGIEKLINDFKLTQEQAAIRIGKSRTAVAHTLRLLTLPDAVIQLVEQSKLSAGHARCLVTVSDKTKAVKLATLCVKNNLSVRDLEKLLQSKKPLTPGLVQQFKPQQSLELRELTRKLTSIFLTKVNIQGTNQKGRISIDYFTPQDLIRIRKHIVDINDLVSVDEILKKRLSAK